MTWPRPGCVRLGRLVDGDGQILDEAIVVGTADGTELHLHGGPGTLHRVIACLEEAGFEQAACKSIRMPSSLRHARALLSARYGPLSALGQYVTGLAGAATPSAVPAALQGDLDRCLEFRGRAARLSAPPVVAIVGRENAGKSTLFNALIGGERALVAPEAGTTRDTVRVMIALRGAAVELHDTAGLSSPSIATTDADLLVHLVTSSGEPVWPHRAGQQLIRVLGKADIRPAGRDRAVSARSGIGLAQLLEDIAAGLELHADPDDDLWVPADPELAAWLVTAKRGPT